MKGTTSSKEFPDQIHLFTRGKNQAHSMPRGMPITKTQGRVMFSSVAKPAYISEPINRTNTLLKLMYLVNGILLDSHSSELFREAVL